MRMKIARHCVVIGVILATAWLRAAPEVRRPDAQDRRRRLRVLCHGMNTMAVVADDGVILVGYDAEWLVGAGPRGGPSQVTDKPVTTIINTNSHQPHSGNNYRFVKAASSSSPTSGRGRACSGRDNFQGASARRPPADDVSRSVDADARQGADRPLLLRPRQHRRRRLGRVSVAPDHAHRRHRQEGRDAGDHAERGRERRLATRRRWPGDRHHQGCRLVVTGHMRDGAVRPTLSWSELGGYQGNAGVLVDAVRKAHDVGRQRRRGRVPRARGRRSSATTSPRTSLPRCGPSMPSSPPRAGRLRDLDGKAHSPPA